MAKWPLPLKWLWASDKYINYLSYIWVKAFLNYNQSIQIHFCLVRFPKKQPGEMSIWVQVNSWKVVPGNTELRKRIREGRSTTTHTWVEWPLGVTWATSVGTVLRNDLADSEREGHLLLLTDWGFLLGYLLQDSWPALHSIDLWQNRHTGNTGMWTCL